MTRYHNIDGKHIKFTLEEETTRDAKEQAWNTGVLDRALSNLRFERNNLLAETDWWGVSDNTMTSEQTKYRQDLRDITNGLTTVEQVKAVEFPEKPSGE